MTGKGGPPFEGLLSASHSSAVGAQAFVANSFHFILSRQGRWLRRTRLALWSPRRECVRRTQARSGANGRRDEAGM